MGASRKLQGEIDRVLKKVQEGVDVFDSIWNKVYDTDNANQKEKFEADLKKEIKKLQRYRDQIKTWIQSSEIKDKKALMDARKLIEREMERFKICEKETKTKAFSKEGLGQQPKTDPKEKAKSETRDWLNNVVGELESQIDSFEAEIEGLSVKKGKTRPPRLTHLESSITRHKAHIKKLEWILRLLDNDELSPEQVNDVKDFLDDYVERNQEDFEDFCDVDDLYNTLPLDKVESLEDLVTIGPPAIVKGVVATNAVLGTKTSLTALPAQQPATATSIQEQAEQSASLDSTAELPARTAPPKTGSGGSTPSTPIVSRAAPVAVNASPHYTSVASAASKIMSGPSSDRSVLESAGAATSSTLINMSISGKEEEPVSFPGRKPSPVLAETALRGVGRGGLSNLPSTSMPLSSGSAVPSDGTAGAVPLTSEIGKRNILGADEKLGSSGIVQPPVSPLSNRMIFSQTVKTNDGNSSVDGDNISEGAVMAGKVFSPSLVSGMQWRPGSPFQNQSEVGQFRGRAEIAPDQREKFLERFQQVQQHGQSNLLGIPPLNGGNHKQYSAQQQNTLLQQFNSQSSSVSPHLALGVQAPSLGTVASSSHQQPNSTHQQLSQQALISSGLKDAEVVHGKAEDPQQQNLSDNSTTEPSKASGFGKNLAADNDLKPSHEIDAPAGVSGSLIESSQVPRDSGLSPGHPLQSNQSSGNLGVIGRKSVSDLGAIGDNLGSSANSGTMHDQLYNLQMLEAAYYKLPKLRDSERAKTYTPKHPAIVPQSYPQAPAPIVNNPAFWERIGSEYGPDTLFFAFYYQQNTYQQYLAAKELKKQSWRYHRKYNTWFQRHEEPNVTTDEYEQGTYVYFDYHSGNDEIQHGWCQRLKTEFTFEYNYLEDELII
ncbi:general negative regulator of transcription subunit 3 isoform X2 [Diospyros lotus]|uniref:general negative regulator of transcription subunit 3 isoform X2 n=1 Tax=Diospyros lotus TaxID=55363 RepID=UPI002250E33A|nr:general negative regulator of transcription subunit 3 isoform X2 [Diospyros lotus]